MVPILMACSPSMILRHPFILTTRYAFAAIVIESYLKTYEQSVHGQGLTQSGLVVTAVCADCHGAHGIFYAADRRSTLHTSNVAESCRAAHIFSLSVWPEVFTANIVN